MQTTETPIAEFKRRRALWVEALRSGEFLQTNGFLHRGESEYCCLGVACELYRRETGDGDWTPTSRAYFEVLKYNLEEVDVSGVLQFSAYEGHKLDTSREGLSTLPRVVADWFGIDTTIGDYRVMALGKGHDEDLATLNDYGYDFASLANIIERGPDGLFTWTKEENQ